MDLVQQLRLPHRWLQFGSMGCHTLLPQNSNPAINHGWRKGTTHVGTSVGEEMPTDHGRHSLHVHLFFLILICHIFFIFSLAPFLFSYCLRFSYHFSFSFFSILLFLWQGLRRATQDICVWGPRSTKWFRDGWRGASQNWLEYVSPQLLVAKALGLLDSAPKGR